MQQEATGAGPPSAPGSARPSERWLFGPAPDLLLGCGVGYLAFTALLLAPGTTEDAPWAPFATVMLGLVTNTPHYGATFLRVYAHRRDRRRYAFFAVHATLLILALFVGGLYWAFLGSVLLSIYVTWSPWHFAGQNYGLALMFLRRRGIPVDTLTKRLLYASFVLSFLITFFAIHGGSGRLRLAPVPRPTFLYEFLPLGLPGFVSTTGLWVCGVAYVLVLVVVAASLLRRARPVDLVPSALLVLLQALWFSVPALLVLRGEFTSERLALSTIWVAVFHSIQYLWVTSYYAQQTGENSRPIYLGKTVLAGAGLITLPALLVAPALSGAAPFDAGTGRLFFAVVNIHHFLLDGAIWKLRDGPIARALLRAEPATPEPIAPEKRLGRRLAWLAGAAAVGVVLVNAWELEFGVRRAMERGDTGRVEAAIRRLSWIGRDSHVVHFNLGLLLAQREEYEAARPHLEQSIALYPTAEAWTALGNLERVEGHYQSALAAVGNALSIDAEFAMAHTRRGETLAGLGEFDAALAALRVAQRLAPDNPNIRASLARVEQRLRIPEAERPESRPPP